MIFLLFALIKILWTAGLVFIILFLIIRIYKNSSNRPVTAPINSEEKKIILPLRLQACERIILYLERIIPNNLIMRMNTPDLTASQLQTLLVRTIREEFEYNLSQQLYLSSQTWELVKNAKEETISMINQAGSKVGTEAQGVDLARAIFDEFLGKEKNPIDIAIDAVKGEIRNLY